MADFTWSVTRMNIVPVMEGMTDMVVDVAYTCTGTQAIEGTTYTAVNTGVAYIPYEPTEPWVDYPNITEEIALHWCWEHSIKKDDIEARLQADIDMAPRFIVETKPLPW